MKAYQCQRCQARIFFENLTCLSCGGELAYAPDEDRFFTLDLTTSEPAAATPQDNPLQVCGHRADLGCNWLLSKPAFAAASAAGVNAAPASTAPTAELCDSCRYTLVVPPLANAANQLLWSNLERAKRALFYSLRSFNLPIPDRMQQPESGLAFEFLADQPDRKVLTGHTDGVIVINIAEADDVQREQRRVALHEPYRTLLGHLRHEIGHFYWDQLVRDSDRIAEFRQLFGDERVDYAEALKRHYQAADNGSWQSSFISRYASAHPWEDWAETWAHYLHINDALDTASHWDISLQGLQPTPAAIKPQAIANAASEAAMKQQINAQWLPLCQYLNAACRSLGEPDAYPYVLSLPVIDKLAFVHSIIRTRQSSVAQSATSSEVTQR